MSKIEVTENGVIQLESVYNPIVLKTAEGVEYSICMRDYGLEIAEKGGKVVCLQPGQLPKVLGREPWSFCEKEGNNCTMNMCDEYGCQERKRNLVDPSLEVGDSPCKSKKTNEGVNE